MERTPMERADRIVYESLYWLEEKPNANAEERRLHVQRVLGLALGMCLSRGSVDELREAVRGLSANDLFWERMAARFNDGK